MDNIVNIIMILIVLYLLYMMGCGLALIVLAAIAVKYAAPIIFFGSTIFIIHMSSK